MAQQPRQFLWLPKAHLLLVNRQHVGERVRLGVVRRPYCHCASPHFSVRTAQPDLARPAPRIFMRSESSASTVSSAPAYSITTARNVLANMRLAVTRQFEACVGD